MASATGRMREYAVRRQITGKYRIGRLLLLVLYAALPSALLMPTLFYGLYPLLVPITLLEALLIRFTWPLTSVEYEYATDGTEVTFSVIRGGASRRDVVSVPTKCLALCAPLTEAAEPLFRQADKSYDFRSSPDTPCPYWIRFSDGGRWIAVAFDGFRPMIEAIRFRNAPITEVSPDLPDYE